MKTAIPIVRRYGRGAITLHWLIAVLILVNIGLAWTAEGATRADKMELIGNHKAVGLLILLLSVTRLAWRLIHDAPPFAKTLKRWEVSLAKAVHWTFYFLLIVLPLAGFVLHSVATGGLPVSFFGLFDIPGLPLAKDRTSAEMFSETHKILATLTMLLLALHVAGALKHLAIDRDGTMQRILPGG